MFLSILKFYHGYVYVRLTGYAPERFLNLCSNRNILIWNLKYEEDAYVFCISLKAFFELRPILKKTRTKITILEKCGLPFWMHRYRKRKVFLGGVFLFIGLLYLLSQFIWNIEINGNEHITDATILEYLTENDLSFGTAKKKIDATLLEENLRIYFDDIIWTSVKISGTKMTIDLKENIIPPKEEAPLDGKAYDLVADKDATIDSIITRRGTPLVQKNAAVKKGDTLVCGRLEILSDDGTPVNYQYCVSDADIIGVTQYIYSDEFARIYNKKNYTGEKRMQYAVNILSSQFKIPGRKIKYKDYDVFSDNYQFHICSDFYFPVSIETNSCREYQWSKEKYTKEQAKEMLSNNLKIYLEKLKEKDIQIVEKNVMIEIDENTCRASGPITVKERIGSYQPTQMIDIPADEGITEQ